MEDRGLKITRKKTEYMVLDAEDAGEESSCWAKNYKGQTPSSRRIQSGWNCKDASGVLRDQKISVTKEKFTGDVGKTSNGRWGQERGRLKRTRREDLVWQKCLC